MMAIDDFLSRLPDDALVPVAWVRENLGTQSETHEVSEGGVDLTVGEVAKMFRRSPPTIRAWCANGRLKNAYRFLGREWRIPRRDLEALQRANSPVPEGAASFKAVDLGRWRHKRRA